MSTVRCKARSLALSSATVSESEESGEGGDTATLYWLKQAAGKSTLPRRRWNAFSERVHRLRGSRSTSAMLDFVVYVLYRAGSAVAAALPLPFLFAFGQFLGACAWMCSGKYRRLASAILAIAFANEKSPRELRRLVRAAFSAARREPALQRKTHADVTGKNPQAGEGGKHRGHGARISSGRSCRARF